MNAKRIAATIPALGIAAAALVTIPAHATTEGTIRNDQSVGCNAYFGSSLMWKSNPADYPANMVTSSGGGVIDAKDYRVGQMSQDGSNYGAVNENPGYGYDKMLHWETTENGVRTVHIRYEWSTESYAVHNAKSVFYAPTSDPSWHEVPASESQRPWDGETYTGMSWTYAEPSSVFAGTYRFPTEDMPKNTGHWFEIAGPASALGDQFENSAELTGQFDDSVCKVDADKHTTTTPAVTKTTHVPAVTKTVTTPAHHTALVQIDTYHDQFANGRKLTAAQIKTRDAARIADKKAGKLLYRKGSASTWLWGSTSSKIETVDLCAMPKLPANTDLWVLGTSATKANPWGTSHNIAQTTAKADCAATTRTVVVTPAHDVTTVVTPAKTTTTYTCADGTDPDAENKCIVTPPILVDGQPVNHGGGAIGGSYGG